MQYLATVEQVRPVVVGGTDAALDLGGVEHVRRTGGTAALEGKLAGGAGKDATAGGVFDVSRPTDAGVVGRHHVQRTAETVAVRIGNFVKIAVLNAFASGSHFLTLGTLTLLRYLVVYQLAWTPGAVSVD